LRLVHGFKNLIRVIPEHLRRFLSQYLADLAILGGEVLSGAVKFLAMKNEN
jgi:hypothetical protein